MKLSRNVLTGLFLLAGSVSAVFAAGQQEGAAAAASDDGLSGTLKVQLIGDFKMKDTTDPVSGEKIVGVHYLKEEFEKLHPGVTVEFVLMGWDSYTQKTQVMLQAGEADVYQVPGVAILADQGLLEPLAPYIEKDNFDLNVYIDNQVQGWLAMGPEDTELSIYGLPFIADTRFIAYDKKLFDEWGVEYLSANPSIKELEEKGAAMTGTNPVTGEQNYGLRFKGGKYASDTVVNIAEHLGGRWGTGFRWAEMKTEFNSPEFVEAVSWMKSILPYCPPGTMARQGDERWMTQDNNIAINFHSSPGDLQKIQAIGLEDRIGISRLFINEELGMGNIFAGSPAAIGANSQVKDIAWEWLKFTSSNTFQKYFWEEYRSLPSVKSALEWESMDAIPQIKPVVKTLSTLWGPRYPYRASQPRGILAENVEKAILGLESVDSAMNNAQAQTEAWLLEQ